MSQLFDLIRWLKHSNRRSESLISIEISAEALRSNLRVLESVAPAWQVAPVLKSNAYGHGLNVVASIVETESSVPFICVDSYFEAEQIRRAGFRKQILIIGHTRIATILKNRLKNIKFVIHSLNQLREVQDSGTNAHVHIKFDTGMNRQGIPWDKFQEVLDQLSLPHEYTVEGIMSHFCDAEVKGSLLTKKQMGRWNEIVKIFRDSHSSILYYHIANSAGFDLYKEIQANVGRSGEAFYGYSSGKLQAKLQPALRMSTIISETRTLRKGESIGYNGTFTASHDMQVATIPAGYFEGIDRRLSNKGSFKINGQFAQILGRVSMNISSCDVSDIPEAHIGTPVIIISEKTEDQNSIESMSKISGAIRHELLVHISGGLKRTIVE